MTNHRLTRVSLKREKKVDLDVKSILLNLKNHFTSGCSKEIEETGSVNKHIETKSLLGSGLRMQ